MRAASPAAVPRCGRALPLIQHSLSSACQQEWAISPVTDLTLFGSAFSWETWDGVDWNTFPKKQRQLATLKGRQDGLHRTMAKQNPISAFPTVPAVCRDRPLTQAQVLQKSISHSSSTACSSDHKLHEGFSLPERPMNTGNVTLPTQKGNTEIHSYFPWAKQNSLNITQYCQPLWGVNASAIRGTSLFKWHLYGRCHQLCHPIHLCQILMQPLQISPSHSPRLLTQKDHVPSTLTPLSKSPWSSFL